MIRVVPYDPRWPASYEAEAGRLRQALDDVVVRIHHFSSTAIPGLSTKANRHLAFRDYMIAHPEAARAYGALKKQLAERFPNDMNAYMDGKDSFVKYYEREAIAWRR
jgi:GrpB-like predicted nucleotidyltransferase (UPF0157 family)